jgi:branched-chain amino acid transport system ATP-binding protein
MMDLLRAIAAHGITIVLIEHNMRLVMGVSERVLVMVSGRVLTEGAPRDVQRHESVIASYLGTAPERELSCA